MRRGGQAWLAGVMAIVLAGVVAVDLPAAGKRGAKGKHALANCFWEGPISTKRKSTRGFNGRYFNFPEESATYWMSRFELPAGAKVVLRGRYPHGRYMSLNSYADAAPTDTLSDIAVRPRKGSTNPFVTGNRRDLRKRAWVVTVLDESPPSGERAPNTLYAGGNPMAPIEVFYRVYEPDRGLDLTGGTGLPRHAVKLSDGTVLRGKKACAAINDPDRDIPVDTTPENIWEQGRAAPPCDGETNPAKNPPRWERFFTYEYAALAVAADCTEAGRQARLADTPEPKGGNYSNRDSAYVYSHFSREFGPVVVLRGRMPWVPVTRDGDRRMPKGQMRFWSLCSGESRVTTFTPDCLADRQVPLDKGRRFTIVYSRPEDRPANARRVCGVAWLRWGLRGDGAGDRDYGFLILRNMLVHPRFGRAIQRVEEAGTEPQVMGPYFPQAAYTTKAGFEQGGC